ncbi:MAG: DUF1295 domain-containing protein [Sumerlaeia bacterium]
MIEFPPFLVNFFEPLIALLFPTEDFEISALALFTGLIFSSVVMLILFVQSEKIKNVGVVDVGWSYLMGLLALLYALLSTAEGNRKWIVAALACIWSFRLGTHILIRVRKSEEDGRYQAMRRGLGKNATLGFFVFFQAQALVALLFALPFHIAIFNQNQGIAELQIWDYIGILIWIFALGGEAIADYQLEAFKKKPTSKGKTCREGLWRYSRHPNYFFEWLHWFAYVCLSIGSAYWYVSLIGPILMYIFLVYVSGIPWTEKQSLRSRGDDYRRYQQETNAFFPWFPKSTKS